MIALIDGDLLAYRSAAVTENDNEGLANWRAEQTLFDIIQHTEADNFIIFLGGLNNFRKILDPTYKANRKEKQKPKYLKTIESYLMNNYGAIRINGIETDDALGILQSEESVICSIDKDLLQVPGNHYRWPYNEWLEVTSIEGLRQFYKQLLIGDKADNVYGVDKIGKVKAGKLLDSIEDESEMFSIVKDLYNNDLRLELNGYLLWILKTPALYRLPGLNKLKPKLEVSLEYIQETETGNVLFTEHGMNHLTIDGTLELGLNQDIS